MSILNLVLPPWASIALSVVRAPCAWAWDMIRRYPWQAIALALLATSAWLWHGKSTALTERDAARATIVELNQRTRAAAARIDATNHVLAATAAAIERNRNAQIAQIAADRDALLDELRARPTRAAAIAAAPPGTVEAPPVGIGAGLYREDAEFLVREAARADDIRVSLIACYAQYDDARARLEDLQERTK